MWLAVDRVRNKVVDFEVTESRSADAFKPLAKRIKNNYNVDISTSGYYAVYNQYIVGKQHVMTKKETSLVESNNSLLRHYLARFNRKTKRYSKAIDMVENSILLLFNKNILMSILS